MSFFVTRPPEPVPGTWDGSIPCSPAMRATTGDTNALPLPLGVGAADGAGAADGSGAVGAGVSAGDAASASAAASAVAGAGASSAAGVGASGSAAPAAGASEADPPICPSFVPTSTVSPSWTRICVSVPEPGLGTSVSTLSVEISSSGSSASTCSPSCFSQRVIVPSETDTPICGITTSTAVSVAMCFSLVLRELAQTGDDVVDLRDECLLERRRERDGRIGSGEALHRRVEILERLLRDRRRDLAAEAAGARVFVQDEHFRRLPHCLEHGCLVPRHDGAQVEDLDGGAVGGELLRRFVGRIDHRAPRDHRYVAAFAVDARLAERCRVALLRDLALDPPVKVLVLEVEDGARVLDRADQEALRVLRRRRADAFQARDVRERRLGVLGVERPAREAAARREADDHRHRSSGAPTLLRGDRDELVPGARDEVGELHLRDRAEPHDRSAGAAADDGGLGERCIDDAPRPELLLEAERDLEGAAVDADVLADEEHALVAPHLRAETVRDRLEIGQLWHV